MPDTNKVIAVKAFKARCLKHLLNAKALIDEEAEKLVREILSPTTEQAAKSTPSDVPCKPNKATATGTFSLPNTNTPIHCRNTVTAPPSKDHVPITKQMEFGPPSFDIGFQLTTPSNTGLKSTTPQSPSPPRKCHKKSGIRSPLSEAKLLSDSFLWARRAIDEVNLNASADDDAWTDSPVKKVQVGTITLARQTWPTTSGPPRRDPTEATAFYTWATKAQLNADM